MSNPLVNFIVRGFQFLFGVVILGLSVSMIRDHHWGSLPSTLGFAAAVGGITIVGSWIGIAASFVSFLEGPVGLIVDGFVAIINAAGGIAMAVKLNGVKCEDNNSVSNAEKLVNNDILNGGCEDGYCWNLVNGGNVDKILSLCRESQADTVFMFLVVVLMAVAAVFTFLRMRKGY